MNRGVVFVVLLAVALAGCAHVQTVPAEPAAAASALPEETSAGGGSAPAPPEEGANSRVFQETTEGAARDEDTPAEVTSDPLRPWNRVMYAFNDRLYFWVLKPVAQGYKAVLPSPVRTGVKNFFHNLATPGRFVNDLLQGKVREAGIELGSFVINTTWGVLGLVDWTGRDPDLRPPEEDTGQTFGRYGVGPGPFIMWPVLGPSTLRDSVGQVGDFFLDPVWYVKPWTASSGITLGRRVSDVSYRIGDYEALKEAAIDPYEAVRDAYLQHRAQAVKK